MPAWRRNASATVTRSGSAKGSASVPRQVKTLAPAVSAARRKKAAQSRIRLS